MLLQEQKERHAALERALTEELNATQSRLQQTELELARERGMRASEADAHAAAASAAEVRQGQLTVERCGLTHGPYPPPFLRFFPPKRLSAPWQASTARSCVESPRVRLPRRDTATARGDHLAQEMQAAAEAAEAARVASEAAHAQHVAQLEAAHAARLQNADGAHAARVTHLEATHAQQIAELESARASEARQHESAAAAAASALDEERAARARDAIAHGEELAAAHAAAASEVLAADVASTHALEAAREEAASAAAAHAEEATALRAEIARLEGLLARATAQLEAHPMVRYQVWPRVVV